MRKNSKRLTDDQRSEIKNAPKDVTNADLAKKFGISQNTVNYHRSGGSSQRAPSAKQAATRSGGSRGDISIGDIRAIVTMEGLSDKAVRAWSDWAG